MIKNSKGETERQTETETDRQDRQRQTKTEVRWEELRGLCARLTDLFIGLWL